MPLATRFPRALGIVAVFAVLAGVLAVLPALRM
ncbi:hypothetical protein BH23ACT5_BH23ACT5_01430 [soil metagenome]